MTFCSFTDILRFLSEILFTSQFWGETFVCNCLLEMCIKLPPIYRIPLLLPLPWWQPDCYKFWRHHLVSVRNCIPAAHFRNFAIKFNRDIFTFLNKSGVRLIYILIKIFEVIHLHYLSFVFIIMYHNFSKKSAFYKINRK